MVVQVLHHCTSDRQTVVRARSPTDLVQDDERAERRLAQNRCRLDHFHHEGTLTGRDVVLGTDAGENAIHQPDSSELAGTKEPICAKSTISAT
jgi:hypothetical protein